MTPPPQKAQEAPKKTTRGSKVAKVTVKICEKPSLPCPPPLSFPLALSSLSPSISLAPDWLPLFSLGVAGSQISVE